MSLAERRDIFRSSNESDAPSPRRNRSLESNHGGGKSQFKEDDSDAEMRHNQDDRAGRGVDTSIDTTQEARDLNVLRVAPKKKAWLPSQQVLDHLSDTLNDLYRIKLFDSSRVHVLDSSASDFRTQYEFYIDVFFKHRWFNGNHNRDGASLIRAGTHSSTTLGSWARCLA